MFYVVPLKFNLGEVFKVKVFENEEKLVGFLRNVRPNDYKIIEGKEIKVKKREMIDLIRGKEE